ncbi:MAG: hypothetical protein ACR2LF_02910 [Jatrophihabitantaceae bacterium]
MTTESVKEQVRALLRRGMSYEQAGGAMRLPAGLVYQLASGLPADGSHGQNAEPTQQLVNPPSVNPTSRDAVHAWVRRHASTDRQMQQAKARS